MIPSPWLWQFLKSQESFRPTAYLPTRRDVWTIGYGHTFGVKEGDTCTYQQAHDYLTQDGRIAVSTVNGHVKVPLTQGQFDALCSFTFNLGSAGFEESHLLVLLNDGHYAAAAEDMLNYDHQGGKVLAGLLNRRAAEKARFES